MIDLVLLVWQFLLSQTPGALLGLVPWHLLAVLTVLSVLAAFGLHFLLGHVLRFYRRKERVARWLSVPTALVLLASVPLLLVGYLLAVHADGLVRTNLNAQVTERVGRLLLQPAFAHPELAGLHPDEITKEALQRALSTSAELEYREQLRTGLLPASELAPQGMPAPRRAQLPGEILVQLGLRWVTAPHNTWFAPLQPPRGDDPGAQAEDAPFFLPDFLASLVDEMRAGTLLPREDWEHVVGTRFVEGILRPLMVEYLTYLALAVVVLLSLLDAAYYLLMRRLRRIGQPKPAKARKAAGKGAAGKPLPPAVPGSAPQVEAVPATEATGSAAPVPAVPAAPGGASDPAPGADATSPGDDTPAAAETPPPAATAKDDASTTTAPAPGDADAKEPPPR